MPFNKSPKRYIARQNAKTISMKIFTIGHSTRSIDEFIKLLKENEIKLLADVRSHPGSRHVPWFNKESLEIILKYNDIEYCHLNILGGRKKSYDNSHYSLVSGWKNASFLNYASYTLTPEYESGIQQLLSEAAHKKTAIMCAESVPWRCHRLLISNTLFARGVEVHHIMDPHSTITHALNKYGAPATIQNGKVLYPSSENN